MAGIISFTYYSFVEFCIHIPIVSPTDNKERCSFYMELNRRQNDLTYLETNLSM